MQAQDKENKILLTQEDFLKKFDAPPKDTDLDAFPSAKQLLEEAKKRDEGREVFLSDIGFSITVGANISEGERKEIAKYYDQSLTQMMSAVGQKNSQSQIIMNRGHHSYLAKNNGQITLTQTWTDPTFQAFSESGKASHTVPGTITSRFTFTPHVGFELQTVEFSNNSLYQLIQNPPTPSAENFAGLIQAATKIDAQQNPGARTITRKKLLNLYPSPRGESATPAYEMLNQETKDISGIPSIVSALIKTNSPTTPITLIESNKNPVRKLFTDEKGKPCCRITLTNPEFKLSNPGNYKILERMRSGQKLSGIVTLDYIYDPEKGYQFQSLTASNAVLYRFILNTPQDLDAAMLADIQKSSSEAEKGVEKTAGLKLSKMDLIATLESNPKTEAALDETKISLKELQKSHAVDQLKRDKARIFKDGIHISEAQEAEAGKYFDQAAFGLPNFITVPQTDPKLQVLSEEGKIKGNLFNNPLGETICRMELTNPKFSLAQGDYDVVKKDIPGKITLEYVFEAGKGFELRSIEFSNAALKNLVLNPPKNPTPTDLEEAEIKAKAAEQKNPPPITRPSTPGPNNKG